MQHYTVYLSLEISLHVSDGISTHHQENTQLYLRHPALVKPLLLPAAIVEELELQQTASSGARTTVSKASNTCKTITATCNYRGTVGTALQSSSNCSTIAAGSSNGLVNARCRRYSCRAPDNGWRYHPKHVQQFREINELCNVTSFGYISILHGSLYTLRISAGSFHFAFEMNVLHTFACLLDNIFTCKLKWQCHNDTKYRHNAANFHEIIRFLCVPSLLALFIKI